MTKEEILKQKVRLLYTFEISGAYESECTLEEFFGDEIYKNKRLLSAQLDGVTISNKKDEEGQMISFASYRIANDINYITAQTISEWREITPLYSISENK